MDKPLDEFYQSKGRINNICKLCFALSYSRVPDDKLKRARRYTARVASPGVPARRLKYGVGQRVKDMKRDDRKRGRTNDITTEWFWANIVDKPCTYCDEPGPNGADRIDNRLGHLMDNVVPACKLCNMTRGDRFTCEEMAEIGPVIRKIVNDR